MKVTHILAVGHIGLDVKGDGVMDLDECNEVMDVEEGNDGLHTNHSYISILDGRHLDTMTGDTGISFVPI